MAAAYRGRKDPTHVRTVNGAGVHAVEAHRSKTGQYIAFRSVVLEGDHHVDLRTDNRYVKKIARLEDNCTQQLICDMLHV